MREPFSRGIRRQDTDCRAAQADTHSQRRRLSHGVAPIGILSNPVALVDQARQSTVMRVAAIVPFTSTPSPVEGYVLKVKLPV